MDFTSLITAFPNLAVGILCAWYAQQVIKERVAAQERHAQTIEAINVLYLKILERAVQAIENSINQSESNAKSAQQLRQDIASSRVEFRDEIRSELRGLNDTIQRLIRDSAKRSSADRGTTRPGGGGGP